MAIRITISGGEAFQRDALTSEIVALLESLHVPVELSSVLVIYEENELAAHINHVAHHARVIIERKA